jgi:protein-tyrosine kinase
VNRLFEALSNLEMEQSSPPASRPGASSLPVIPTSAAVANVVAPATDRETKTDPTPLKVARLLATVPETIPQDVTAREPFPAESIAKAIPLNRPRPTATAIVHDRSVRVKISPKLGLVTLTEPKCWAAEKFRALVTQLCDMRKQGALKSFQITSSTVNEGKTLVATNVAVTLAKYSGSRILLFEGDLHRPALAALLGLEKLRGLGDWWSGPDLELGTYIHQLRDLPFWFLPAGQFCGRPSDILSSARFVNAFTQLAEQFEWVVVDSTPMLPIVDVNLWSKLVDGTLLVVREGQTPIHMLKKGLQALIRPKLIGVVMNDVSGSDQEHYNKHYSAARKPPLGRYDLLRSFE